MSDSPRLDCEFIPQPTLPEYNIDVEKRMSLLWHRLEWMERCPFADDLMACSETNS